MLAGALFKGWGKGCLLKRQSHWEPLQHQGPRTADPTSVVPAALEVYKHRVHVGLLFHIFQCRSQTRSQGEESWLMKHLVDAESRRCPLGAEETSRVRFC